jgi:hypothetical protein
MHIRNTDKKIFYVGKGSGSRAFSHHQRGRIWSHVVNKHGFHVEILMRFEKEKDCFEHEKFLISCLKDCGIELINQTEGGEGSSGFKLTDETKRKIGIAVRSRGSEINKKISDKLKGRKLSEETKLKMSASKLGVKKGDEHKKNISLARVGKVFSEKTRHKLSEAAINQHKKRREQNAEKET